MKNIAITFVLLGLSNTSFSYNDPYEQNEPYVERESELISPNFKESSFDYKTQEEANNKTSYCFKKTTEGVCEEIQEYMLDVASSYFGGSHEYMDLKSCEASKSKVQLEYRLVNDYGDDFKVSKTLKKCN